MWLCTELCPVGASFSSKNMQNGTNFVSCDQSDADVIDHPKLYKNRSKARLMREMTQRVKRNEAKMYLLLRSYTSVDRATNCQTENLAQSSCVMQELKMNELFPQGKKKIETKVWSKQKRGKRHSPVESPGTRLQQIKRNRSSERQIWRRTAAVKTLI